MLRARQVSEASPSPWHTVITLPAAAPWSVTVLQNLCLKSKQFLRLRKENLVKIHLRTLLSVQEGHQQSCPWGKWVVSGEPMAQAVSLLPSCPHVLVFKASTGMF